VHALHIWSLGTGHDAITVHVQAKTTNANLGARLSEKLREEFAVEYATVQVDADEHDEHDHDHDHS